MIEAGEDFTKDGSVLAWVRFIQEGTGKLTYDVAVKHLTDAPLEIRRRYIEETEESLAQLLPEQPREELRSLLLRSIAAATGNLAVSESARICEIWREVDPRLEDPINIYP